MEPDRRRRYLTIVAVVLVPVLSLAAFILFQVGSEGLLPWQPEPTRIPITPFVDLQVQVPDAGGTPSP